MTYKTTFKLIIAASEGFNDYELLRQKCDGVLAAKINDPNTKIQIVYGVADNHDSLEIRYASERDFLAKVFKGNYKKSNILRYLMNVAMADYADALIAFDCGSVDIAHIIKVCETRKKLVRVIKTNAENKPNQKRNTNV